VFWASSDCCPIARSFGGPVFSDLSTGITERAMAILEMRTFPPRK